MIQAPSLPIGAQGLRAAWMPDFRQQVRCEAPHAMRPNTLD